MEFCKFANDFIAEKTVTVDNAFVKNFMPSASSECLKVYLYGLYKCNNLENNTIQDFCNHLNLNEDDVVSAFHYWQDQGLVQVLNTNPIEIRFLPVHNSNLIYKKFNKDKYKDFNATAQDIINGRMITPNEYSEYYNIIESLGMEPDALIMIIKYSANLKGTSVGYPYIVTVAKNWAYQGIKSVERVEERLCEQEKTSGDIKLILQALGRRSGATEDEYDQFLTWTKDFGFDIEVLVFLAKTTKNGGFNALDRKVNKFHALNMSSKKEIEEYFSNENELYTTAKNVCKSIGVRYEDLSVVVEKYVSYWVNLGYTKEICEMLANYCFFKGIKTLEGLNDIIQKFYKKGLVNIEDITKHLEYLLTVDEKVKEILTKLGIERRVIGLDREFYQTWINDWEINNEVLDYAITLSSDKYQAMQFLNKLLSKYFKENVKTVEDAKKIDINFGTTISKGKDKKEAPTRSYNKKDLDSLFTIIKEVDL